MDKRNKKTRGREKLAFLTYDDIAELSGYTLHTVRKYASMGVFEPRDLHSAMSWVNEQRAKRGQQLIGIPEQLGENNQEIREVDTWAGATPDVTPIIPTAYGYNPLKGEVE